MAHLKMVLKRWGGLGMQLELLRLRCDRKSKRLSPPYKLMLIILLVGVDVSSNFVSSLVFNKFHLEVYLNY